MGISLCEQWREVKILWHYEKKKKHMEDLNHTEVVFVSFSISAFFRFAESLEKVLNQVFIVWSA